MIIWKVTGVVLAMMVVAAVAAWLVLRAPDIPFAALDAKYAGGDSHFVELPGGLSVHYREDGDPSLPPLVLLHGFGDSFTTWDGWVRELQGRFHILIPDFPGHGLTRAPFGYVLTGDGLADFVDEFASQLGLAKFAVAGNSMGGGVAWRLAVRHPERLSALILLDAAGFPNESRPAGLPFAFKILQFAIGRAVLRNIDNRPLIESTLKGDVYDKALITPALVERWAEFQRAPGHRTILMAVNFGAFGGAAAAPLQGIRVPTLIMHGQNDTLIEPGTARNFAAAIPGARLLLYDHVGHLPQSEIPRRSALDAAEFLQLPPR